MGVEPTALARCGQRSTHTGRSACAGARARIAAVCPCSGRCGGAIWRPVWSVPRLLGTHCVLLDVGWPRTKRIFGRRLAQRKLRREQRAGAHVSRGGLAPAGRLEQTMAGDAISRAVLSRARPGAALRAHTRPCARRRQINGGFCSAQVYLAWLQRELVDAAGRRRRRRCDWAFEFDQPTTGQITINC